MKVDKIMTKNIVTVEMDDSLHVVKKIFDSVLFHHLLVVEGKKLFGVLSDRDLFKALSPNIGTASETSKDTATLNKKVHQIMTRKPVVVRENTGIYEVVEIFNRHNISCVPVVDDAFRPIGIISWRDILKAIEANRRTTQPKVHS